MGYKLHEVKTDDEFTPLFFVFRDGFTHPPNNLWHIFVGDVPCNQISADDALKESTSRMISWHRPDPTSTWVKVVDEATGEIVAGGRWAIYESERPYNGHGELPATWFREGEPRIVATQLLNQFLSSASRQMNRPHVLLNIIFTSSKHRRQGAASLVMDWGIQKAKERGLDIFIEATKEGKPLYEKYGFDVVAHDHLRLDENSLPPAEDPKLRKEAVQQLTPFEWWSMLKKAEQD